MDATGASVQRGKGAGPEAQSSEVGVRRRNLTSQLRRVGRQDVWDEVGESCWCD